MNSFVALTYPLALLLPAIATWPSGQSVVEAETARAAPKGERQEWGLQSRAIAPFRILENARKTPTENQVRIEQRVVIRIGPSSPAAVARSMARIAENADRFEEVRIGNCLPITSITAVEPANENRLILFMNDRRVLSAALERACNANDFYSGFYVERSDDGQICTRRDKLQSRAGASCRITRLSRLVAARD